MAVVPSKTVGQTALAWQDLASAAQAISSVIDLSTIWAMGVMAMVGRGTGTAFTSGWPNVRIEVSGKSSGNDAWVPLLALTPAVGGSSIVNTTLNGAVSAGATTVTLTSATNVAAGDLLFLGDSSTANYELVRVKSVSGSVATLEEACTYAHANAALVTDQAESYAVTLDVSPWTRARIVLDNAGSGQAIRAQVLYTLFNSF